MRSRGYYFQYAKTDLGRIFERKYAEKYFPERKSPNQGTKMVADENNYRSSAPHHAKTSECQRAGPKLGGRGASPPRLFASGLSLEKAWIPRPGPGGKPRCRSGPAPVQTRPTCQGQTGTAYPSGGCLGSAFGAQRPGGLPARRETHGAGSNLRPPSLPGNAWKIVFCKKFLNSLRFPCKF